MKIIIVKNYEEVSQQAATLINEFVEENPYGTIGFATGYTPKRTYEILSTIHRDLHTDWSNITTFNLDEYVGLKQSSPLSYYAYMQDQLFSHINIDVRNINIPIGKGDLEKNAKMYEEKIIAAGGLNLQLLGIGHNGHIAFNEPGTDFASKTSIVELSPRTIKANAHYFKSLDDVPKKAITMGLNTIMQAQAIILLASGKDKAQAIYEMIEGKITTKVPASILQNHDNVIAIIDQKAASKLHQNLK